MSLNFMFRFAARNIFHIYNFLSKPRNCYGVCKRNAHHNVISRWIALDTRDLLEGFKWTVSNVT